MHVDERVEHPSLLIVQTHQTHAGAGAGGLEAQLDEMDDAALLRMGSTFAATGVRRLQDAGRATHLDPDAVGETMARLFASFVLLPAQHAIDVRTQEGARDYARRTLVSLLMG